MLIVSKEEKECGSVIGCEPRAVASEQGWKRGSGGMVMQCPCRVILGP
jgi:hypothetical protein